MKVILFGAIGLAGCSGAREVISPEKSPTEISPGASSSAPGARPLSPPSASEIASAGLRLVASAGPAGSASAGGGPAGSATPVAASSLPPLVNPRVLRYREVFTGMLPGRTGFDTWTLSLGEGGRFSLVDEQATGSMNSLIEGRGKPLEATKEQSKSERSGTWTSGARGEIVLVFGGEKPETVRCRPRPVQVLDAGALLHLVPIPGDNGNRVSWKPARRTRVEALGCERESLAGKSTWLDEPQPDFLAFGALPGIEYAHDNDDMVVQKGGLRRLP